MQEGEKKSNRKALVTTSITSVVLFVLPFAGVPENAFFLIPGVVEIAAIGVLWRVAGYRVNVSKKKKSIASDTLRRSIDDDIESLKRDIENAPSATIARVLSKQLVELYKERGEESAVLRKDLREDIKKYGDDNRLLQAERDSIQDSLVQKVGEEIEKASEAVTKLKAAD
jgi:hypothetical protein